MIETLLILWNIGLSILLVWAAKCQHNQSILLYALRDDLNKAKICDGYVVEHIPMGDDDYKVDLRNCPNVRQKFDY